MAINGLWVFLCLMLSSSSQSSQVTGVRKEKKNSTKVSMLRHFPIILAINHSISTLQYYHIPYLPNPQDFLFYLLTIPIFHLVELPDLKMLGKKISCLYHKIANSGFNTNQILIIVDILDNSYLLQKHLNLKEKDCTQLWQT